MKVSELTGAALDWAVAKCEGYTATIKPTEVVYVHHSGEWHHNGNWRPSTNWAQGGPIIEREKLAIAYEPSLVYSDEHRWKSLDPMSDADAVYGPTPLIAAMRCVVASKLGDEVALPEGWV